MSEQSGCIMSLENRNFVSFFVRCVGTRFRSKWDIIGKKQSGHAQHFMKYNFYRHKGYVEQSRHFLRKAKWIYPLTVIKKGGEGDTTNLLSKYLIINQLISTLLFPFEKIHFVLTGIWALWIYPCEGIPEGGEGDTTYLL